jgi:hypothetical protein
MFRKSQYVCICHMSKLLVFRVHVIFVKEIIDAMNRDAVTDRSTLHLRSYELELSELTQAVSFRPSGRCHVRILIRIAILLTEVFLVLSQSLNLL